MLQVVPPPALQHSMPDFESARQVQGELSDAGAELVGRDIDMSPTLHVSPTAAKARGHSHSVISRPSDPSEEYTIAASLQSESQPGSQSTSQTNSQSTASLDPPHPPSSQSTALELDKAASTAVPWLLGTIHNDRDDVRSVHREKRGEPFFSGPTLLKLKTPPSPLLISTKPGTDQTTPSPGGVAGQKRTASGSVKPLGSSGSISPVDQPVMSSSASATTSPIGGGIGELSAQLRARLSYAMIKVQNGWQSRSIEEVESLSHSYQASPTSATSTLLSNNRPSPSSRSFGAVGGEENGGPRSSWGAFAVEGSVDANKDQSATLAHDHSRQSSNHVNTDATGETNHYSPMARAPRTYESFWRDHGTSTTRLRHVQRTTSSTAPSNGGLAPPADIVPSATYSRRSRTADDFEPPRLSGPAAVKNVSNLSNSPVPSTCPATPPPIPSSDEARAPLLRTPSQKAAMEQDAVETLIFMSSPGNSQRPPQERPIQTMYPPVNTLMRERREKLAAVTSATARRVAFDSNDAGSEDSSEDEDGGIPPGRRIDDSMDVLLDTMSGEDSSDDDLRIQTGPQLR
ncbi:MAG: hypothetical protein M1833_004743 [Piccolia ochrophora]|nr:MAG: hypothetical protein M1833_004743 [Piccolia ochrophora]